MSSSIAIPKRKKRVSAELMFPSPGSSGSSYSSSPAGCTSAHQNIRRGGHRRNNTSSKALGKQPTCTSPLSSSYSPVSSYSSPSSIMSIDDTPNGTPLAKEKRPSLLSSSISRSEHTVINIGHDDSPWLISCVKASQGFDWNQEIFLPSYIEYDADELEHKRDPVEDIVLTDEEMASIFPS